MQQNYNANENNTEDKDQRYATREEVKLMKSGRSTQAPT